MFIQRAHTSYFRNLTDKHSQRYVISLYCILMLGSQKLSVYTRMAYGGSTDIVPLILNISNVGGEWSHTCMRDPPLPKE
jgi:hypothetical protein